MRVFLLLSGPLIWVLKDGAQAETDEPLIELFGRTFVYKNPPSFESNVVIQEGNNKPQQKIELKKSSEIKSNLFGAMPAQVPRLPHNDHTAHWIEYYDAPWEQWKHPGNFLSVNWGITLDGLSSEPLMQTPAAVLHDDFNGTSINSNLWSTYPLDGVIRQDGELIFQKNSQGKGWDLWDQIYVLSKPVFSRTHENKVLVLTLDLKLSPFANYILGFYPSGSYLGWSHSTRGVKYGYHGNRLDRALWFMQNPQLSHLLRFESHEREFDIYRLRLELGSANGALWQYDTGSGWKTARDTRNEGTGDARATYQFFISANFYDSGSLGVDNVIIDYTDPSPALPVDPPSWTRPTSTEFNGKMDEGWTNWAGDLGVSNPPSVANFGTVPGWLLLHGPAGGWGMFLRHYPFFPLKRFPFYVEVRMRYPVIDSPNGNYAIILTLLTDLDNDPYTDDIAYPSLVIQNLTTERITQVRVQHQDSLLTGCQTSDINLGRYWSQGDVYIRIGIPQQDVMNFAYRFDNKEEWVTLFTYDAKSHGKTIGFPLGCDLIGPCQDSGWPWPPAPQCRADQVSFEIDYVRFYSDPNSRDTAWIRTY